MPVRVHGRPLSVARALRELEDPSCGGVVVFLGRVRPDGAARGRVRALLYEADRPMARRQLEALERRARDRFGARRIVVWHRTGELPVGTISVLVGVAAPHRAEAFDAAEYLIDALKVRAAIWKTDLVGRSSGPRRRRPAPRRGGRPAAAR